MAFNQYPDNIAVEICTGGPFTIDLGEMSPDEDQQLEVFGLQIFKRGLQPTVSMRINAYVDGDIVATSEDVMVGTIEDQYPATDNFYGWVRFTFSPRFNFNASNPTHFELELDNYAYTEAAVWIGAVYDWPVQMAYNSSPGSVNDAPIAVELYGAI